MKHAFNKPRSSQQMRNGCSNCCYNWYLSKQLLFFDKARSRLEHNFDEKPLHGFYNFSVVSFFFTFLYYNSRFIWMFQQKVGLFWNSCFNTICKLCFRTVSVYNKIGALSRKRNKLCSATRIINVSIQILNAKELVLQNQNVRASPLAWEKKIVIPPQRVFWRPHILLLKTLMTSAKFLPVHQA